MPEVTIQPTECVWMGEYHDLPAGRYQIGWAFFGLGHNLSNRYLNDVRYARQPISVICPSLMHWEDGSWPDVLGGTPFCIDSFPTPDDDQPNDPNKHWDVAVKMSSLIVGQKPLITVNPSIHLVGIWHGWLQNGILHN